MKTKISGRGLKATTSAIALALGLCAGAAAAEAAPPPQTNAPAQGGQSGPTPPARDYAPAPSGFDAPGYVIAARAPFFYYPAPPPAVVYGPGWYRPWVSVDGRWSYRPYRYWYWNSPAYWRPDWRPGRWATPIGVGRGPPQHMLRASKMSPQPLRR